jgi:hypothetical protein
MALVNFDLGLIAENPEAALKEILSSLSGIGGLDYLPRERTPQGRLFDHACDSRILLNLLLSKGVEKVKAT